MRLSGRPSQSSDRHKCSWNASPLDCGACIFPTTSHDDPNPPTPTRHERSRTIITMAEVIGLVASVAQLVHLSGTLLAGGYGFLCTVTRAPSEIRSLLTEAAAVNSLLGQLQLIAESTSGPSTNDAVQALKCLGVFDECQATLEFIRNALARCQQDAGKDVQNFGRRLKWPFKEQETKDALQRLHRLRSVLANAVEVDSA
jgi:hypothetical protein